MSPSATARWSRSRSADARRRARRDPRAARRQRRRQEHARQAAHRRDPAGRRLDRRQRQAGAACPRPRLPPGSGWRLSSRTRPSCPTSRSRRTSVSPASRSRRSGASCARLDLDIDFAEQALDVPLPMLRMLDLARALARDPQLLILDEITAALPSDLAERVFEVMRRQRERHRSALFITHRLREVIANCDRATILRDGQRRRHPGADRGRRGADRRRPCSAPRPPRRRRGRRPPPKAAPARERVGGDRRRASRSRSTRSASARRSTMSPSPCDQARSSASPRSRPRAKTSCSPSSPASAGPTRARSLVEGRELRARHPYDAIRAGVVLVPADRLQALLPQRSVAENIAAPRFNAPAALGADRHARRAAARPRGNRAAADRHARAAPGAPALGRQPAEGDDRAAGSPTASRRCSASTPRGASTSARSDRSTRCSGVSPARAPPSFSSRASWPRSRSSATASLCLYGGRITAELDASAADEATLLRAMHGLEQGEAAA